MAGELVPDSLWILIEPLLPPNPPKPKGGRPSVPHRQCLMGIIFVLKTGIPWELLPREMGCGCGMTCWRRLHDWTQAQVWERVLQVILSWLRAAGEIDLAKTIVDSSSVRAVLGGRRPVLTR
jgi:transposase